MKGKIIMRIEHGDIFSEKNDLFELLKNSPVCCGLCCAVILDKYAGRQLKNIKRNGAQKLPVTTREHNISLNSLDIITQGKILERLLNDIRQIDAFDKVDPYKLSRLTSHLQLFFEEKFLIQELKGTFAKHLLDSWKSKLKVRLIAQKNKENISQEKSKIRKVKKREDNLKRIQRKEYLDNKRELFLNMFQELNDISKLKILLKGIEIPIQAIPDVFLPEASLKLRFQVKKEFTPLELTRLRKIFGENFKNNKIKSWKKLIKVMR